MLSPEIHEFIGHNSMLFVLKSVVYKTCTQVHCREIGNLK